MCCECWGKLFNVVTFLPSLRDQKAIKPDSLSLYECMKDIFLCQRSWCHRHICTNSYNAVFNEEFFTKHCNRLLYKGLSSKPIYREVEMRDEGAIIHLEYTKGGDLIPNRGIKQVYKEKELDILKGIHYSPERGCTVVELNSIVKQFSLRYFCNSIRQLATQFLKSCPDCQLHTSFLTVSPPPCPIRSYSAFERLQADLIDMAPGPKRFRLSTQKHSNLFLIRKCNKTFYGCYDQSRCLKYLKLL